jgi:hypothetical protein
MRGSLNPKLCNNALSNIYSTAMRPIQLQITCGNSESWNFKIKVVKICRTIEERPSHLKQYWLNNTQRARSTYILVMMRTFLH